MTDNLFQNVVAGGFCIGCGVCAAFDINIEMGLNQFGCFVPKHRGNTPPRRHIDQICPFSDLIPNETELGIQLFAGDTVRSDYLGYYLACYIGWATELDYRARGSSGGLTSWLMVELLNRGLVDYVVHVAPELSRGSDAPLFAFGVSSSPDEVRARAKSRYYPVEMSKVIRIMLRQPGRYAVVALPCFIKAIRLACRESPLLNRRVVATASLVCGQLKSTAFAEALGWQCGFNPGQLESIDFRTKRVGCSASDYGVTAKGNRDGIPVTITRRMSELVGGNWGHGLFKYKACDFCDDVVGETADISFGDSFLPQHSADCAGTNIVIVRSKWLDALLVAGQKKGRVSLERVTPRTICESQAASFRHRRQGLAFRLSVEDDAGRWRPRKRVAANRSHLNAKLQNIQSARYELSRAAHAFFADAKLRSDLAIFLGQVEPAIAAYESLYRDPFFHRILRRVKSLIPLC